MKKRNINTKKYAAVVVGTSAGGVDALMKLIPQLKADLAFPIFIVQHIAANSDSFLVNYLDSISTVRVKEAEEKEPIENGVVYFAPPNYHLLIEEDKSISFTVDEKINYSRPSIDVLFETAAMAYRSALVGIVLTGANRDGAKGLQMIHRFGGLSIVQNPSTAYVDIMPLAAIKMTDVDHVMDLDDIALFLNALSSEQIN